MATAGLDPNSAAYRKAYKHYLKSAQTAPTSTWSAFRVVEKQYKTRFPPPSLHEVIDLTQVDGPSEDISLSGSGWALGSCEPSTVSEVQVSSGSSRAFEINDIPGAEECHALACAIFEVSDTLYVTGKCRSRYTGETTGRAFVKVQPL